MSTECGKEGWAKVRSCLRDLDFCIYLESTGKPLGDYRS